MLIAPETVKKTNAVPPPLPKRNPPAPKNGSPNNLAALPGIRERTGELATSMATAPLAAVAVVAAWALFQTLFMDRVEWPKLIPMFAITVLTSWAVLVPSKIRERSKGRGTAWARMTFGALIGLAAFYLDGWMFPTLVSDGAAPPAEEAYFGGTVRAVPHAMEHLIGYVLLFSLAMGLTAWSDYSRRRRKERFSLGPVFGAGLVAFLLWIGWNVFIQSDHGPPGYMLIALAGTAGVVQLVSPWTPPPPPQPKRRRLEYA